ncbi:MAG: hypothetical protein KDC80_01080 [Saprospiraceae bacterium]|nr:hypothetical protein [Saprospiraceae bacterium]
MISNEVIQGVNVVNETLRTSEARDIISGIIDKQINFYKLQHFREWIGNHYTESYQLDEKINQLEEQKQNLMEMIEEATRAKKEVHINCLIELEIEYEPEFSLLKSA